jgi:hypothetical protein
MKNTKKLIIGMFFLIFALLILQSCERVESVTGTENDFYDFIDAKYDCEEYDKDIIIFITWRVGSYILPAIK